MTDFISMIFLKPLSLTKKRSQRWGSGSTTIYNTFWSIYSGNNTQYRKEPLNYHCCCVRIYMLLRHPTYPKGINFFFSSSFPVVLFAYCQNIKKKICKWCRFHWCECVCKKIKKKYFSRRAWCGINNLKIHSQYWIVWTFTWLVVQILSRCM